MVTLAELFPDNVGRMALARVVLKLKMPELISVDTAVELDDDLCAKIRAALDEIEQG